MPDECVLNVLSSRACERGTKCCTVRHAGAWHCRCHEGGDPVFVGGALAPGGYLCIRCGAHRFDIVQSCEVGPWWARLARWLFTH